MTAELKEAIEYLKEVSEMMKHGFLAEAIDTVVAELEKPTYTAEDMEAFAEWIDINGYKQILKGVWHRDISYQQKMTTTQLRNQWEEESKV